MGILQWVLNIAIPVFAIASMFVVGARYRLRDILRPFMRVRGLALVLIANFVMVPLLSYGVSRIVAAQHPALAMGLILVGTAAGAPFLLQLTGMAGGNLAFSSGLLVILLLVTIATMPFLVPLAEPRVVVEASAIALPLLLTMLLPLGIGSWLRMAARPWAERALPIAARISVIALYVLVVLTLVLNFRDLLGLLGTGAILASLILIIGAYGIGLGLGEVGGESRAEVGMATAQRNIAAASVVAIESFHDPDMLVMVVIASLVGLAILFPIAGATRRRRQGRAGQFPLGRAA